MMNLIQITGALAFFTMGIASCTGAKADRLSTDSTKINQPDTTLIISTESRSRQNISLIPLEIIDSTKTNAFEKYGISFSGLCYDCDISRIKIAEGKLKLINICDSAAFIEVNILKLEETASGILIKTQSSDLVFEKIENNRVYKLTVRGKLRLKDNLKLLVYFASDHLLNKFHVHDCGEFDG